jgi:cytochrome P450
LTTALRDLEAQLREYGEVRSSEVPLRFDEVTGAWTVFRHQDASEVLNNHKLFSNMPPGAPHDSQYAMLFTDPPRHRQLRSLVSKAFTPRAIAQLETRLRELMDELLDQYLFPASFDVVGHVSDPLPIAMIAELLGVDTDTRAAFKRWSHSFTVTALSQSHRQEGLEEHVATLKEMFDYFADIIENRRQHPRDDLITALVEAEEQGQRLSELELKATCAQLLAAGNETTTNLIGNSVLCLGQRPELAARLRAAPDLIPAFVEEVLRYLSPVQYVPRYARERAVLHGSVIEPGKTVFAHIGAANRDPECFDNPDSFVPDRAANRHIAFGLGPHFCLGAALARLETKVAIEQMLSAIPGEWVVPESLSRLPDQPFFFGLTSLPLTWREPTK